MNGGIEMGIREKLVELLEVDLSGSDGYEPELIADYLIDHGVTVQAMDLERYGDVRVVSVEEITPWKQEVIERG